MNVVDRKDTTQGRTSPAAGFGRLIPSMPTRLPARLTLRNAVEDLPFADRPRLQTYSGRVAIYQGLKALGLGAGDAVLVPAYACGSEIDAVLKVGCDVVFYPVNRKLEPDLAACQALLPRFSNIRALFVTHYFGFAQPIQKMREFSDKNKLMLIEDCAHGFLGADPTGTPLGSTGDVAIFSYMKGLPLTDGGACVINRLDLTFPGTKLKSPDKSKLVGRYLFQIERSLETSAAWKGKAFQMAVRGPARLLKSVLRRRRPEILPVAPARNTLASASEMEVIALDTRQVNWAISPIARATLGRLELENVRLKRRSNYSRFLGAIKSVPGVRPLFDTLPAGICPLFIPIELDNAHAVQRQLAAEGLATKYFWSFFHEIFPASDFAFETALKTRVLALPVHQDLDDADIDRAAGILASVMKNPVKS